MSKLLRPTTTPIMEIVLFEVIFVVFEDQHPERILQRLRSIHSSLFSFSNEAPAEPCQAAGGRIDLSGVESLPIKRCDIRR